MASTFMASDGQDHERMAPHNPLAIVKPVSEAAADDAGDDGLTASQKMLSATSGSLLTSLLGAFGAA
jgi:solute carrier family 25, member 39/40